MSHIDLRRYGWECVVALSALALGVLVFLSNVIPLFSPLYRGVLLHRNADEFLYLARVEEALSGGWMGTAFSGGGERLPVLQPALIEWFYGMLGRPFGIHVARILLVEDFFVPSLLFLVLVAFCRSSGLRRISSLAVAWAFAFLELYNLNRPIHQRTSFFLLLLALFLTLRACERRSWVLAMAAGVLFGVLPGVYFWSWTAGWGWLALLFLLSLRRRFSIFPYLLIAAVTMVVVAAPFFWNMWETAQHSLYSEAFFRSGIGFSHTPESWIWSFLFALMAAGVLAGWGKGRVGTPVACTVLTAFLLLNQHVAHGILFLFASHYLFFLVLAAALTFTALWGQRQWHAVIAAGAAVLFLSGIAYDNRHVFSQWFSGATAFTDQHLASALPVLRALPRSVVLSDPRTSSFLAAHTQHDVLFSPYIQHELRSHRDIAERYCMTQLPLLPSLRLPENEPVLVYGDAYSGMASPSLRTEEFALVAKVCAVLDGNSSVALARFRVAYVFWNEQRQPGWELSRLGVPLEEVAAGEGWSLLTVSLPG